MRRCRGHDAREDTDGDPAIGRVMTMQLVQSLRSLQAFVESFRRGRDLHARRSKAAHDRRQAQAGQDIQDGPARPADIAGPRQVRQHLRKAHRQLPFQPARLLRPRRSPLRLLPTASQALRSGRPRLRRFGFAAFGFGAGLLPRLDRRRIPRDVLHQMAIHRPRNQRLMQTAGQTALGKLGKGPRKRRLARKPAGTAPAARKRSFRPWNGCRQAHLPR